MKQADLKKLISKIEPDRQQIAQRIIEELDFLQKTLKKLRQAIENGGVVSSALEIKNYNQSVKSYSSLLKQLELILRKSEAKNLPENPLNSFIEAGQ